MDGMMRARIGAVLTALVALFLLWDGIKHLAFAQALKPDMVTTGWPFWTSPIVGVVAIAATIVYVVPRTAVIGAGLIAGFLGGAIATRLRIGEIGSKPQLISIAVGAVAWGALWLRGRLTWRG